MDFILFIFLHRNNADIPFSSAYLASLVQSLYNLMLAGREKRIFPENRKEKKKNR